MSAALIEELQAGPGSRDLSDKVLLALGWTAEHVRNETPEWSEDGYDRSFPSYQTGVRVTYETVWENPAGKRIWPPLPDASRNLQDAVDLVGEDFGWSVTSGPSSRMWPKDAYSTGLISSAPTPALALCISIIKARSL